MARITTLFLDLGGVVLTNGWDHNQRHQLANQFGLDWDDFERRHSWIYNLHETDKITLDEYLQQVVFWQARDFSLQQFKAAMYALSQPYTDMLQFVYNLKKQHGLTIALTSNEGRDLADYRIKTFDLGAFADYYFVSCYIYYQKPDLHFYKIALDVTQVAPESVLYIDDRENGIKAASALGIRGIVHKDYTTTSQQVLAMLSYML